jgi:signal transduction histidine kinase
VPLVFFQLQRPCAAGPCLTGQLTADGIHTLTTAGVPITGYAAIALLLVLSVPLVGLSLAVTVAWQRPNERTALFLAFFFATCPVGFSGVPAVLADLYPALTWSARVVDVASLTFWPLFCVFPDGRFVPRWSRWLLIPHAIVALTLLFPSAFSEVRGLGAVQASWFLGYSAAVVIFQLFRYQRVADETQRRQIRSVLTGLAAIAVSLPLFEATSGAVSSAAGTVLATTVYTLSVLLCMATIWVALLRHRLFGIELILNRALVYVGLTAGVAVTYALVVGGLGALLRARGGVVVSLVAAGVVGVVFHPLRERLQAGVNRLLYGGRDEPYAVVSRLSRRLAAVLEPDAVLPAIVQTVTAELKLPYAALALRRADGSSEVRAAAGTPNATSTVLALHYQGERIGELIVAPRSGEEYLGPADRRLLEDLARQAGVAAHAIQLTDALRRSREQLVAAREEERRRLRRDLHDGLGPALATITMQGDTARGLVRADPDEAESLLAELTTQAQATIAEVRRLIHGLRPPVLDDLGLVAALRALAASFGPAAPEIAVEAPTSLPPLPAATEVAVYRIAQEALTNAVRHAAARHCVIGLSYDEALRLSIRDDGRGLRPGRAAGVGLASMRERAEELGGSCRVSSSEDGGTVVEASLPLKGHDGTDPAADH